jgi:hypothetical protein
MIYVIAVPRFVRRVTADDLKTGDRGNIKTETCIKIGFTKDFKRRQLTYLTNTPRFDILYLFPEGTDVDEYRLHQRFDKYRDGQGLNGKEWFKWNEEIIDFFENNTTIVSFDELGKFSKNGQFEIQSNAFRNATNLESIDLSTVTTIGPRVFYGCSKLR